MPQTFLRENLMIFYLYHDQQLRNIAMVSLVATKKLIVKRAFLINDKHLTTVSLIKHVLKLNNIGNIGK